MAKMRAGWPWRRKGLAWGMGAAGLTWCRSTPAGAADAAPGDEATELGALAGDAMQSLHTFWRDVWSLELFRLGSEPVYLSQIVSSLVLLAIGIALAKWFTNLLAGQMRRRGRIGAHAIALVQRLVFYTLSAVVGLIALDAVGIPISSLAFLGGALAIGVGFGAQNLLNNFMSGIVLMFEQPIRVGDMIEVEGALGTVEAVGVRCTRIRRTDGIDVLVPNSRLLENQVVNWTLTDDRVRSSVAVGVAYGSPTTQVRDLILQAVMENDRVIHQPAAPEVLFEDFGDNALTFRVFFWTHARSEMQVRTLASAIRFRVDELFAQAGISIAFPQRDLHLDTLRPLQIKLLREGDAAGAGAGAEGEA